MSLSRPSKLRRTGFTAIITALGIASGVPAMSEPFSGAEVVIHGIIGSSESDIHIAKTFSDMAQKEEEGGSVNYGLFKKLWCEGTLIAPTPENLAGCARGNYGAFLSASNSPITQKDAAQTSLKYLLAGSAIAGTKFDLSDDFRSSMSKQTLCLFAIANETEEPSNCPAPYGR